MCLPYDQQHTMVENGPFRLKSSCWDLDQQEMFLGKSTVLVSCLSSVTNYHNLNGIEQHIFIIL